MGTWGIRISQSQITNKIHQIQLHPQQQPPIIMSSNDNTSSLQSVMDTATGYINSGIAAVTGSAGDQAKADQYKTKGEAESDLSHTAAKAGPFHHQFVRCSSQRQQPAHARSMGSDRGQRQGNRRQPRRQCRPQTTRPRTESSGSEPGSQGSIE